MKLEPEQKDILAGEKGIVLANALKTMVQYGNVFEAKRLVPIKSSHLAGTFGVSTYKSYYRILEQMVEENITCRVPTTINPRPGHQLNWINRIAFSSQKKLDALLSDIGVIPNYSCVCYDGANIPEFGDRISWAESSAVQYANSVLGARTNRNSLLIDLCSAVTGFAPEFGYLLDENRRGRILIRLDVQKMDASALGFIIGQRVVDKVPVLENYPFTPIELKNMGGAMAASGGVALFHVEGLTPEAPDLAAVFAGNPEKILTITQNDLDALRDKDPGAPDMVVFGCPQMTFEEAMDLGGNFEGEKAKLPVWFCLVPEACRRFKETETYQQVVRAGVSVFDFCPTAALTPGMGKKKILTASGKCYYYLDNTAYGTVADCLAACGV
ncbi:MAG: DUF521 domain-containing protein [Desulfobacteraceae bacterium]|nr:DUF521 domain-containing protein [Desulfobacteraceae bacterium]MBU4001905.1 aconitase X catalytic domain-containing protein [Pseudomonadota bacterium]MBU4055144.1 aconitase X catalytic domain-containing protein [Pseudomonadota bacterium]